MRTATCLLRLVAINRQPIAAAVLRRAVADRRLRRRDGPAALRASRAHARDGSGRGGGDLSRPPRRRCRSCASMRTISARCTPCSPRRSEGFEESDDELVADHLIAAGVEDRGVTYLVRAADAAAKALAFDRAARLYRRALSFECAQGDGSRCHPPQARRRARRTPGAAASRPWSIWRSKADELRGRAGAEAQGRAATALQRSRR